ncbi:acyltransferase [Flavobacterium sp. FZUC8N2.13]|uniref:Acyltransferase n=1 Tax=Flavobacterium zubiriense TaxID=3138075 RepID=A0ABV4T765_9FLAO
MEDKPIFLPGLNGIRTIAAIGVMMSHINLALNKFNITCTSLFGFNEEHKPGGWLLGEHGVTMFFVLSGFLITFLLHKEFEKTGNVNIKAFYIRRILRIWPLYYLYFFIVIITLFVLYGNLPSISTFLYYSFFLANVPFVTEKALPALDHFWSIGVEEQFYLFWPFLFVFCNLKLKKVILFLITVLALFRIFIWYKMPFSLIALYSVVNRFDCMLLGALGAILYLEKSKIIDFLNLKFVQYFSWFIMLLLITNQLNFFNSIIEIFLIAFVTLCIIIGQINVKNRVVNLENTIMSYLGRLSFGIYVYHPLLILLVSHFFINKNYFNELIYTILVFSLIITFTVVISHFSYFYFENRFLRLKSKFSIIHSTNSNV